MIEKNVFILVKHQGHFLQGLGSGGKIIDEPGAAMVLTLESTQISACSCGSLVSKGRFTGKTGFTLLRCLNLERQMA